jgi:Fur family ferric uptake transcriptional regulator
MASERKKAEKREKSPDGEAIERALVQFRAYLRDLGHRHSVVREAVARAALGYEGHFEVNDLVRELREVGVEDAHPATVYRSLPLLVHARLIAPVLLSQGERQFYERVFERAHHDHLICLACGKVVEFEFEAFEVLQQDVAARHGFELIDHVHELVGRCADCKRAGRPPKDGRGQG